MEKFVYSKSYGQLLENFGKLPDFTNTYLE